MKNIFSRLALGILIASTGAAQADLLLEPYIGYQLKKLELIDSSGNDDGGKTNGVNIGGRVGYMMPVLNFWAAADVSVMASGKFESADRVSDGDLESTNVYATIGYDFPVLLRAWFGYGVSNILKTKFDTGGHTDLKGGTHVKFGVGFTPLPLISLNVEYFTHDYEDYTSSNGTSGKTKDAWSQDTEKGVMLSASVPLTF
jgi:hypothetical protein